MTNRWREAAFVRWLDALVHVITRAAPSGLEWRWGLFDTSGYGDEGRCAWMAFVDHDLDPGDVWFLIGPDGPEAAVSTDGRAWTTTGATDLAGLG